MLALSIYQAAIVLQCVFCHHINCSTSINETIVPDQQIPPCHQYTIILWPSVGRILAAC